MGSKFPWHLDVPGRYLAQLRTPPPAHRASLPDYWIDTVHRNFQDREWPARAAEGPAPPPPATAARTASQRNLARGSLMLLMLAALCASACSPLAAINKLNSEEHYRRHADIPYGEGPRRRLDVYQPTEVAADAPLVVFFYGGGWDDGTKEKYQFVAASLAEAGIVVVIPDYRLYPDVVFPAFIEDAAAAVAWSARNAAAYGVDSENIYLMGHSAGAHMAALLATDQHYLQQAAGEDLRLAGLIGLAGPYDFLPIGSGYLQQVFPPETRPDSQPINFVSPQAPPTLLIHGNDDVIVATGNSERFAAALRAADVPVTLKIYDGKGHAALAVSLASALGFVADTLPDSVAFILSPRQREAP